MVVAQTYPARVVARFWSYVKRGPVGACWPWLRFTHKGYGRFRGEAVFGTRRAHRIAYMIERGPIPCGMVLDHVCRNARCVNPWHVEPVMQRENLHRGCGNNGRLRFVAPPQVISAKRARLARLQGQLPFG